MCVFYAASAIGRPNTAFTLNQLALTSQRSVCLRFPKAAGPLKMCCVDGIFQVFKFPFPMSSSDQSLLQFRTEIDAIDQRLVELISRRAELTVDLLQRNLDATNALIVNHQFEPMVLQQVTGKNIGPIPNTALEGIYRQILSGAFELARPTRASATSVLSVRSATWRRPNTLVRVSTTKTCERSRVCLKKFPGATSILAWFQSKTVPAGRSLKRSTRFPGTSIESRFAEKFAWRCSSAC